MVNPITPDGAKTEAERLVGRMTITYITALSPMNLLPGWRSLVYWWNYKIAAMRAKCVHWRRLKTKRYACGDDDIAIMTVEEDYQTARTQLKHRIRESKAKCWVKVIRSVDGDKVVMKKIREPPETVTAGHSMDQGRRRKMECLSTSLKVKVGKKKDEGKSNRLANSFSSLLMRVFFCGVVGGELFHHSPVSLKKK